MSEKSRLRSVFSELEKTMRRMSKKPSLFSFTMLPHGHWMMGFLNWVIVNDPRSPWITAYKRSWPWAQFGLRSTEMRAVNIRVRRRTSNVRRRTSNE